MQKRNSLLDYDKGILIFLVTVGHVIQGFLIGGAWSDFYLNKLYMFIYSFHMPAFMMISGFLFYNSYHRRNVKEILKNKFITLFVPIVCWNVVGFLFLYIPKHWREISSIRGLFHAALSYATLWFLISVLINSLMVIVISQLYRKICHAASSRKADIAGLVFLFLCSLVIPFGDKYVFMLPYYIGGYLLAKYKSDFFTGKSKKTELILCVCFLVSVMFFRKEDYVYTTGIYVFRQPQQFLIDIYRWATGALGTVFIITCLKRTYKCRGLSLINQKLEDAGKYTLPIYAIQNLILFDSLKPVGKLYHSLGLPQNEICVDAGCIILGIVLTIVLVFISKLLSKFRVTNVLFCGGR